MDFVPEWAAHQFCDGVARGFAFIENRVHLAGDWHLEARAVREFLHRARRVDAFRNLVHTRSDLCESSAFPKLFTDETITRETPGTRQHQIAEACEAHERFDLRAFASRETRDLREPACDQCCDTVRSETQ